MAFDEVMQENSRKARHLWDVVEPIAASAYFAPEAHSAYQELGFQGSGGESGGIQFPDMVAYFISRGACLGKVSGQVIAAAFGVFKRPMVVGAVDAGWQICSEPRPVLAAREAGTVAALSRVLGESPPGLARATSLLQRAPDGVKQATDLLRRAGDAATGEGRPLYSGLRSLDWPGDPLGDLWRAADLVREHRGDSHIAAWIAADLDACEIGVITDVWRGQGLKSWVRTRGWSEEELDAAIERLRSRGLLEGDGITGAGWQLREDIDAATDRMENRVVAALGDDIDELFSIMEPLADGAIAGRIYPAAVTWGQPRP